MNKMFLIFSKNKFYITIILLANTFVFSTFANDSLKVVANVNGDIITSYDVQIRSDFMNKILDEGNTSDAMINRYNKQNISESIIDDLIKERLKISEAKRYMVDATESEVKQTIDFMNGSFRMPKGKLESIMKQSNCANTMLVKGNLDICFQMFYADVVWSKFSGMFFGALAPINEKEMDAELKKYHDYINFVASDLNISQIVIADKKQADELYNNLQKKSVNNCKTFDEVGKENGDIGSGNLGYLKLQDTSKIVGEHIKNLAVGNVSKPLKNLDGEYYLYMICNKKFDEKIAKKIPSVSDMQTRIGNSMQSQKIEAFGMKYLEKLFSSAFIEYM
jgi:parvulin-like peptidyl-prolyl isomerase